MAGPNRARRPVFATKSTDTPNPEDTNDVTMWFDSADSGRPRVRHSDATDCKVAYTNDNIDNASVTTDALTVEGNTQLGDANTDTITLCARIDSPIEPVGNSKTDVGSTTNKFRCVYATGLDGCLPLACIDQGSNNIVCDLAVTAEGSITWNDGAAKSQAITALCCDNITGIINNTSALGVCSDGTISWTHGDGSCTEKIITGFNGYDIKDAGSGPPTITDICAEDCIKDYVLTGTGTNCLIICSPSDCFPVTEYPNGITFKVLATTTEAATTCIVVKVADTGDFDSDVETRVSIIGTSQSACEDYIVNPTISQMGNITNCKIVSQRSQCVISCAYSLIPPEDSSLDNEEEVKVQLLGGGTAYVHLVPSKSVDSNGVARMDVILQSDYWCGEPVQL